MSIQTTKARDFKSLVGIIALTMGLGLFATANADSLYVGDGFDNTIKKFDAFTGAYQGEFVKKGNSPLKGPMGLIFSSTGNLLVSNQNANTNKSGEILKHNGLTGAFLGALVNHTDPKAPFSPRGIVQVGNVLFVADQSSKGQNNPAGKLLAYNLNGGFLGDLTPNPLTQFPGLTTGEFHPRGIVLGPDGYLYVSVTHDLDPASAHFNPVAGWILRFNPTTGAFVDVFASNTDIAGCAGDLHRPEGLVFRPDGKLYVTAFRANAADTDKILIFNSTGFCEDKIDLDQVDAPRATAQAILFGPDGFLYVPITNGKPLDTAPATGSIRRYNVDDKSFVNLVAPFAAGGGIKEPWYLTFENTNPGTLAYE